MGSVFRQFAQLLHKLLQTVVSLDRLHLESKHIEALTALRDSDERFRQLAENIPQMFWLTDPELETALYVSPAYETLTGRRVAGAQRRHESWLASVDEQDRERVLQARKIARCLGTYDVDYRIRDAAGLVRWVKTGIFPPRHRGRVCRASQESSPT